MRDYVVPPPPKEGDRVHSTGPFPRPGVVRAVLDEYTDFKVYVVRFWVACKRRYEWVCEDSVKWEYGLFRPGPVPKRVGGRWPWVTP